MGILPPPVRSSRTSYGLRRSQQGFWGLRVSGASPALWDPGHGKGAPHLRRAPLCCTPTPTPVEGAHCMAAHYGPRAQLLTGAFLGRLEVAPKQGQQCNQIMGVLGSRLYRGYLVHAFVVEPHPGFACKVPGIECHPNLSIERFHLDPTQCSPGQERDRRRPSRLQRRYLVPGGWGVRDACDEEEPPAEKDNCPGEHTPNDLEIGDRCFRTVPPQAVDQMLQHWVGEAYLARVWPCTIDQGPQITDCLNHLGYGECI